MYMYLYMYMYKYIPYMYSVRTFFAFVGDFEQINEMRADDVIEDTCRVGVSQLNLDASTQWRKHFGENHLLVPDWLVTAASDGGLALKKKQHTYQFLAAVCEVNKFITL